MDSRSDDEYVHASPPASPVFTSNGGGIFSGSQHFVVAGGTFTNLTKNYITAPAIPSDIRMIPMGDIDLQQQLQVTERSRVVSLGSERRCARRVYSARIYGHTSDMTVAIYQGDRAEEDWRRDIEQFSSLRHPNVLQIWGGASAGNVHAAVFYGDLVPFKQFTARYEHSPIMSVYLLAYYMAELEQTWEDLMSGLPLLLQAPCFSSDYTFWIRATTGRLSLDFEPPDSNSVVDLGGAIPVGDVPHPIYEMPDINALFKANPEAGVITSLTLEEYHLICQLRARARAYTVSLSATVGLGWVLSGTSRDAQEIRVMSESFVVAGWPALWPPGRLSKVGEDGWTRYTAEDVSGTRMHCRVRYYDDGRAWLSQANHVFHRRQITSNLGAYVLVDRIYFCIEFPAKAQDTLPLPGYLFVCPVVDFGTTTFKWPDCPVYWSLDPSGVERLSAEDATSLGFPPFRLHTSVRGHSWDDSIYAGLRQFHQAKGFDSESQDVARHLGHPIYQVSGREDPLFAYSGDEDSSTEVDDNSQVSAEDAPVESDEEVDERATIHDEDQEVDGRMSIHNGDEGADERTRIHDEDSAISQASKFTMSVQLILMFFVVLCSIHDVI